jgi:hypothetical protein
MTQTGRVSLSASYDDIPASVSESPPEALAELDKFVYCVGTQKAGTSWLASRFMASPEIYLPVKEPHYWNRVWGPDADGRVGLRPPDFWFRMRRKLAGQASMPPHSMFSGQPYDHSAYGAFMVKGIGQQRIVADFTPHYAACSARTFEMMAGVHPETRFILLMRDPIDRLWSGIRQRVRLALPRIDDHGFLLQMLWDAATDPHNLDRRLSCYGDIIPALEEGVGRERIYYGFFESLFTDESLGAISDFVDVKTPLSMSESAENVGGTVSVQPDEALTDKLVAVFRPHYEYVRQRFGVAVPASWRA